MTVRRCEQTPLPCSLFCLLTARKPPAPALPRPLRLAAFTAPPRCARRLSTALELPVRGPRLEPPPTHLRWLASPPPPGRSCVLAPPSAGSASSRHAFLRRTSPRRFALDAPTRTPRAWTEEVAHRVWTCSFGLDG
ncbi:hypothetical protein ZWY2020_049133 [Hordeum vulgare]|nr:hypothetical protein ZWY2020_019738 [Hordeum vulgare]KAI4975526.1 hypothetical protein ZWY2020_049133 [Hordeum vulgare]